MSHSFLPAVALLVALRSIAAPALDLDGFAGADGAISVQYRGETVDPYFALQALLLARQHGLDIARHAVPFAAWLAPRQKPDGTFDRFCRRANTWGPCKTADADDSLLALWLRFLETDPDRLANDPLWHRSHEAARRSLERLEDKERGIYLVSPVFQHGLFMDNLEVWSYQPSHARVESPSFPSFGAAIQQAFWDPRELRYHVSTQVEQRTAPVAFYPDAVAQIFPLFVGFPHVPGGSRGWYRRWMQRHRAEWLAQVKTDFAWGLVAVTALDQGDAASARCWLREALPARHGPHWTVTDEVAAQVLRARQVRAATPSEKCG